MSSRMDDFREFVRKYPKLKDEVRDGKTTWQSIYEEWVLYGDKNDWSKYEEKKEEEKKNITVSVDSLKNMFGYIKKINPDDLNKALNTVQKVIQIVQTVGGSKTGGITSGAVSPYNDWWD